MSDTTILPAERRERVGKGAARAVRRAGRVPAVIYGDRKDPLSISLDPRDVDRELHKPGFFATLVDIEVEGRKHRVLPRDAQFEPVSDRTMHVDFLRVSAATSVTATAWVTSPPKIVDERAPSALKTPYSAVRSTVSRAKNSAITTSAIPIVTPMIWLNVAPSAFSRPTSLVRWLTATSMTFMINTPATSRLTAAMPASAIVITPNIESDFNSDVCFFVIISRIIVNNSDISIDIKKFLQPVPYSIPG